MRRPRVAIVGSCVTRDVWNLAGFEDDARPDLLYVSRTSFASLTARPLARYAPPEGPREGLSPWELRMVEDDIRKRALGKLVDYAPTHLIIDLIDERFDLLAKGEVVVAHSWELHLTGQVGQGPLAALRPVAKDSPEATALWRRGMEGFGLFLAEKLPNTRIIFHDARWSLDWLDESGARQPFDVDRLLWEGLPANIHAHNARLARYGAAVRELLPQAFHLRAPAELAVGDVRHRWGLSPFHFTEGYYRYVWSRFEELGCGRPLR